MKKWLRHWPMAICLLAMLGPLGYSMASEYYVHGNFPSPSSPATSASMRAELDRISAGFDKLPILAGNPSKAVIVNAGGTGLTVTTGGLSLGGDLTIAGTFNTTFVQQASTTLTLPPVSGTLATLAGTESLSNKTLTSPIIDGPTFSGTALGSLVNLNLTTPIFSTITNGGTLTLPSTTDTLLGRGTTDTLTNKTYSNPIFSGTASGSLTNLELTTPTLTSGVLTTSTVAADPTSALGIASKQYVDALWTTGDVKLTVKTTADSGWVLMNDGTIGSATSGATTRANADTSALYTLLWTNCANAQCAVSTGRGASAAADFAANKTIALPKALGRALATYGAGSGLTSRVMGQTVGEETHVLTETEMPSHTHSLNNATSVVRNIAGAVAAGGGDKGASTVSANTTGGDAAHNVMQPTLFLNVMIKL